MIDNFYSVRLEIILAIKKITPSKQYKKVFYFKIVM